MVVYDTLRSDVSEDFWVHKWVFYKLEKKILGAPWAMDPDER